MREIKFRVWYKFNEMMWYQIDSFTNMEELIKGENDITFMQYTGLKDKNGKEIYEDDLLLCDNRRIVKVVWSEANASFDTIYVSDKDREAYFDALNNRAWYYRASIIGNIHENL